MWKHAAVVALRPMGLRLACITSRRSLHPRVDHSVTLGPLQLLLGEGVDIEILTDTERLEILLCKRPDHPGSSAPLLLNRRVRKVFVISTQPVAPALRTVKEADGKVVEFSPESMSNIGDRQLAVATFPQPNPALLAASRFSCLSHDEPKSQRFHPDRISKFARTNSKRFCESAS